MKKYALRSLILMALIFAILVFEMILPKFNLLAGDEDLDPHPLSFQQEYAGDEDLDPHPL